MKNLNIQKIEHDNHIKIKDQNILKKLPKEVLEGINVDLEVRVGSIKLNLQELITLKNSSILKLDQLTSDPVDLILDGQIIAQAELVAKQDNLGIKIIHILK